MFDTGQDIASITERNYFPKGVVGWLYSRLAKFKIKSNETLLRSLERLEIEPTDVDFVIISHLHQDHIGGLSNFTNLSTEVVVHGKELIEASKPTSSLSGFMKEHIFLQGLRFVEPLFTPLPEGSIPGFTHGWDIFSDESAVLLEVPGHTSGSVALLLNKGGPKPVLLVGDLTYDYELLLQGVVPGVGNRARMKESSNRVRELKRVWPELIIAASHDPKSASQVSQLNES